jgi:hypothetical protein
LPLSCGEVQQTRRPYLAIHLSLGGGAYAATALNGSQKAPRSMPANRIKDRSIGSTQLQAASVTWHKLHLIGGWKSSQRRYDTGAPRYAVLNGVAYLSGSLHGGTTAAFAILPRSARPTHNLFIEVYTFDGAAGALKISAGGEMDLIPGPAGDTTDFSSLATVSYPLSS